VARTAAGIPAQAAPPPAAAPGAQAPSRTPPPVATLPAAEPPGPKRSAVPELELEENTGDHGAVDAEELTPIDETTGEALLATELAPSAEAAPGSAPRRELSPRELAILESLERLAVGGPAQPDVLKPTQAMAAFIRLLIRKGVVTEFEFLDELAKR
jgi:hypothetical protein